MGGFGLSALFYLFFSNRFSITSRAHLNYTAGRWVCGEGIFFSYIFIMYVLPYLHIILYKKE